MAPQGPAYEIRFCKDNVVQVFDLSQRHDQERGLPFEYDEDDVLHGRLRYSKLAGNRPVSSPPDDDPHRAMTKRPRMRQEILLQMDASGRASLVAGADCTTTRPASSSIADDDDHRAGRPRSLSASTVCSADWQQHPAPSPAPPSASATPAMSTDSNSSVINNAADVPVHDDDALPAPVSPAPHQSLAPAHHNACTPPAHVAPVPHAYTHTMHAPDMFAAAPSPPTMSGYAHHPPPKPEAPSAMPLDVDDARPAGSACCCIIC